MKRTSALIGIAGTAMALLAGNGLAQTPNPSAPAQRPSMGQPSQMSDMTGRHTMDGEVTKVDAKKGWIDVKTPEGSMKLHFPPSALANVKKGDSVTVELGIKDNGPAPSRSEKKK